MTITGRVGESTATGEHACRYVQAHDTRSNYRTFYPDLNIRFRVENGPGDREGPELSDWRFAGSPGPGLRRRPWRRRPLGG